MLDFRIPGLYTFRHCTRTEPAFRPPGGMLAGIFLLSVLFSCTSTPQPAGRSFQITDIQPVLFNDDHNSEGFLARLETGKIMLIFRLDPGIGGSHVGTNAYMAQTTYDPLNDRWSEVSTVYNSNEYDDRNIHGGTTLDGRIVIFFRHLGMNDQGRYTEGRYILHSDDQGISWKGPLRSSQWSDPDRPDPRFGVWGTGHMFHNSDNGRYAMLGYGRHNLWLTQSTNGIDWDEVTLVADDPQVALTEIAGAWTGDNRMIALIRDDEREAGHPLLQTESYDNGKTWNRPVATNIPRDGLWGCAPQLIYDQRRDLILAITSDRYSRNYNQQSLFIYSARPGEIYGHPENWTLDYEILRPWAGEHYQDIRPLNQSFYGYPAIAPINESEYLVVFTERARMDNSEQADLYYFRIIFDD